MTVNDNETLEHLLVGFPLEPKVVAMLKSVVVSPAIAPRGVAGVTLTNLKKRKWIRHIGVGDEGQLYEILPEGRLALKMHARAEELGRSYRRVRNVDADFRNLEARWQKLANISN